MRKKLVKAVVITTVMLFSLCMNVLAADEAGRDKNRQKMVAESGQELVLSLNQACNVEIDELDLDGDIGYTYSYFTPTKTQSYLFVVSGVGEDGRFICDKNTNMLKWSSYKRVKGSTRMRTPVLTAGEKYIFYIYNSSNEKVTKTVGLYDDIWYGVDEFKNPQSGTINPVSENIEMDIYKVPITKTSTYTFVDQGQDNYITFYMYDEQGEELDKELIRQSNYPSYEVDLKPGTYYFGVGAFAGRNASYEIKMTDKADEATGISMDQQLNLHEGASTRLKAAYVPSIAAAPKVTFQSSNASVAKVDNSGNVMALRAGTAVITAKTTDGKHSATCKVTVEGHHFKTITTKATVNRDGSIAKKCQTCGKTISSSTIYYPKTISLSAASYTYNGKVKKPSVTVKGSNGKSISAANYKVSYTGKRKSVGKYNVNVTFCGNSYSGSVTKTFTIAPKGTTLSKLSAGSKKVTVKWKKQKSQTSGYQVQYSTNKNFKGSTTKAATIKKNATTSKTIKKLKAKKKYYVRIRTFKTVKVNGRSTMIYSKWSKIKTVKTR